MHRTGLAVRGDDEAVRWVAVRHAPDHIHIVATLARQDGTRPRLWNDFYQVRQACQEMERRLGVQATAPGDRTAARRCTRAESEKRDGAAGMSRRVPRCAAGCLPPRPARPARRSSSTACTLLVCRSVNATETTTPIRWSAMQSPCPVTPRGRGRWCGTAAEGWPPT